MSICRYDTNKPCENHGTSSRTCINCILDKTRAEIESQEKWLVQAGYNTYNVDLAFSSIKSELKKALEQESCGDAVSRDAVLDLVADYDLSMGQVVRGIHKLPSVTPQQKMGRWIEKDGYDGDVYYDCSACGESWASIEGTPEMNGMKYCPNCGARMEV